MSETKKKGTKSSEKDKVQEVLGVSFDDKTTETSKQKSKESIHDAVNKHLAPSPNTSSIEGVFDVERAFDNDGVEFGTIVSDKKRKHTSIIKSVRSAFNEWLGKTKKSIGHTLEVVEPKVEEPEVIERPGKEDRTKTIKKAKDHTARAPKDDHEIILEKVKTLSKDAEKITGVPYIINGPSKEKMTKEKVEPKAEVPVPMKPEKPEKKKVSVSKSSHIETPDLRGEMVAPVIHTHTQEDINTYAAPGFKQKEVREEKPVAEEPASKKAVPPSNLPTEKPDIPVSKPAHIDTPDLRSEMVAPVINTHTNEKIDAYKDPKETEMEVSTVSPKPIEPTLKKETPPPALPPIKPQREGPEVTSNIFIKPKDVGKSDLTPALEDKQKEVPQVKLEWDDELVSQPPETEDVPVPTSLDRHVVSEEQRELSPQLPELNPLPKAPNVIGVEIPRPKLAARAPIRERVNASAQNEVTSRAKWGMLLRIFIIIVIVVAGVALAIYAVSKFNVFETDTEQAEQQIADQEPLLEAIYVPAFFITDTQMPIPITGNKKQFLSNLKRMIETANKEVTQFYPVVQSETTLQNLSTQEIFRILNTRLGRNPMSVLESVSMFGGVRTEQNEPYIVMRSYNFETLFAGFLEWEPYMYDDFMPLFGEGVLSSVTFTDAVKDNASIRILYDSDGNEVMLYAFINRNTVVITSSTNALSKIIERL